MNSVATKRYGRTAPYPVSVPRIVGEAGIRVLVVYSVCYRYRMPIFRRLSNTSGLSVKFLVGTGHPGTKIVNASDMSGIDVSVLKTFGLPVKSTGRSVHLSFNPTLLWWLIKSRPQVLVLQGGELLNNAVILLYAKARGVPIVWWSLGEIRNRKFRGLSKVYRRLVQFIERQCDAFAAYSSVGVEYFLKVGVSRERIFNLLNVVDTDIIESSLVRARAGVEALRKQLDAEDKLVVLYVGALTRVKAVDRLIVAFSQISDTYPDVMLVIVGDGPEREAAECLSTKSSSGSRIRFVGDVYDGVSEYFLLSDLVVVPGAGGLVVSDAMAHGRPVIAAIGDGVECDLIDHEVNGYLLSTNTVEELVTVLADALSDPQLLRAQGENALSRIQTEANIGRYMNELLGSIVFAYESARDK